ncbi:hypothetical protein BC829DRAFT_423120 [Chytridium lagenaria]|nr:hypothetical protein BC829DRAFT_423120 [Chytridium lagenaria]
MQTGVTIIPLREMPQRFTPDDGEVLARGTTIVRVLADSRLIPSSTSTPIVLVQTREEVASVVDSILGAAHASKDDFVSGPNPRQPKVISDFLKNESQKIRDYAAELPALLSYARALLLKKELDRVETARSHKKNDTFKFDIGDRVWLSMPLRTEKQSREDAQIKKFQFRWSGPMRVIARSADYNRYTIVEVLPDGRLLSRQANAARLRPYNLLPPTDSADAACKGVSDDFAQEIELWKKFAVVQRRPKMKVAEGVNRELFRRFDSDVAEGHYDDPDFYVEKLEDHSLNGREYEYKVKWLGEGPCHNIWLPEREVPKKIVADYWVGIAKTNQKEFLKRLSHIRKYGCPKRDRVVPTGYTDATDNDGYCSDSGDKDVPLEDAPMLDAHLDKANDGANADFKVWVNVKL